MKTFENKVYASLLMLGGTIPVLIDGDATALIFFGCFAVPMFFSKKSWFC